MKRGTAVAVWHFKIPTSLYHSNAKWSCLIQWRSWDFLGISATSPPLQQGLHCFFWKMIGGKLVVPWASGWIWWDLSSSPSIWFSLMILQIILPPSSVSHPVSCNFSLVLGVHYPLCTAVSPPSTLIFHLLCFWAAVPCFVSCRPAGCFIGFLITHTFFSLIL